MALVLPEKTGADFEIPPAGTHLAVCYRIIDLGTQLVEYKGQSKKQHKIMLSWELSEEYMKEGKNEGLPFSIHKRYNYSSNEKSSLRKDLESWRGVPFTDEDFGKFNLGVLLGIPCLLGVVHADRNGKVYANISSITRLVKGMQGKPTVNPTVYFDLSEFDQVTFDNLSDSLKTTIMASPEYHELKGINRQPSNVSDDGYDNYDPISDTPF